jgi:hypothetical protein
MNSALQQVDEALGKLSDAISAHAIPEDLQASYGAHVMPVGKRTLIRLIDLLRTQISAAPDIPLPKEVAEDLPELLRQLTIAATTLVPQLAGSNASYAAPGLAGFLWTVSLRLQPVFAWTTVLTDEKIPAALLKRYRDTQRAVDGLENDVSKLAQNRDHAQQLLDSVASLVKAAEEFTTGLEKLNADANTASEGAKKSDASASETLEKITTTLQRVNENAATLTAASEKAGASAKQIDETLVTVANLAGQVNTHTDNVAKSAQKLTEAEAAGTKAREKTTSEAEQVTNILAQVTKHGADVQSKQSEVDTVADAVKNATANTIESMSHAEQSAKDAESWATKSNESYRIVTTTGLAGAFHQRAKELTRNSLIWLFVLAAALVIAAVIGQERTREMSALLASGKVDANIMFVQLVLSILTVGAPIWMAWLSTKQVAYIFRLAEDYGYKASVAKAYEGFREEAVNLDPQFQARLFASALERLDENPLRLVSDSQPGTPMQELFQQPWFQDTINTVPGFKERLIRFLKRSPPMGGLPPTQAAEAGPQEVAGSAAQKPAG